MLLRPSSVGAIAVLGTDDGGVPVSVTKELIEDTTKPGTAWGLRNTTVGRQAARDHSRRCGVACVGPGPEWQRCFCGGRSSAVGYGWGMRQG